MHRLNVRLLGTFELRSEGGSTITLDGRKSQELLSYLLLCPMHAVTRDVAIEAVWPDADHVAGKKQIRNALWQIHNAVDMACHQARLILADGDHLSMNPCREIWCDAVEFVNSIDRSGTEPMSDEEFDRLRRLLRSYQGPLLDGCYSEWCLIERERLETSYLLGLDEASVAAERRGDRRAAVDWARALLRIDRAHERTHRRLMQLYAALDDRTRALRQFERCCEALKDELDVEPSRRTISVAAAIRTDEALPSASCESRTVNGHERSGLVGDIPMRTHILRELTAMQRAIDNLRRSVEELD